MHTILVATPYIILVGSLLLVSPAFVPILPIWARVAFALASICGVADGVLGIRLREVGVHSHTGLYVEHYKTWFGGITLGLLVSLFLSGQFTAMMRAAKNRRKTGSTHGS